jgi:hypothetical protein
VGVDVSSAKRWPSMLAAVVVGLFTFTVGFIVVNLSGSPLVAEVLVVCGCIAMFVSPILMVWWFDEARVYAQFGFVLGISGIALAIGLPFLLGWLAVVFCAAVVKWRRVADRRSQSFVQSNHESGQARRWPDRAWGAGRWATRPRSGCVISSRSHGWL